MLEITSRLDSGVSGPHESCVLVMGLDAGDGGDGKAESKQTIKVSFSAGIEHGSASE